MASLSPAQQLAYNHLVFRSTVLLACAFLFNLIISLCLFWLAKKAFKLKIGFKRIFLASIVVTILNSTIVFYLYGHPVFGVVLLFLVNTGACMTMLNIKRSIPLGISLTIIWCFLVFFELFFILMPFLPYGLAEVWH